jgi:hypothetical protein
MVELSGTDLKSSLEATGFLQMQGGITIQSGFFSGFSLGCVFAESFAEQLEVWD